MIPKMNKDDFVKSGSGYHVTRTGPSLKFLNSLT